MYFFKEIIFYGNNFVNFPIINLKNVIFLLIFFIDSMININD